ncbi:MAG TPA: hypothetical protein VIG47_05555, partial [Gemmatimonadaceae bacterium]
MPKIEVDCTRCDGEGKHVDYSGMGERYMAGCLSCKGTGKQWETDDQQIQRLSRRVRYLETQVR